MPAFPGNWVWLILSSEEAVTLQAILQACLEAGGNREMIEPISIKLNIAKARQEMEAP